MDATNAAPPPDVMTLRCQFCDSWNRIRADRAADRPRCGSCGKPMLVDRPVKLDDDTFDRTLAGSTVPVLVDFYADWCGPCKMMAPAVDALASKYQGSALVAKLDTDRAQRTAGRFNIRGIPTTIVFVNGAEVARQSGAVPLGTLEQLLQRGGASAAK